MIRHIFSQDPALIDIALKMLFKGRVLVDYSAIEKINNRHRISVRVKCDDDALGKLLIRLKKSVVVKNTL